VGSIEQGGGERVGGGLGEEPGEANSGGVVGGDLGLVSLDGECTNAREVGVVEVRGDTAGRDDLYDLGAV
jgi:hypothetical protein